MGSSTARAYSCARDDLPHLACGPAITGYRRFLALCSHEYFHLWHVKRIRQRALIGAGLEEEVRTRRLRAFEGIATYYETLALVRRGCIDEAAYLTLLARLITRVMRDLGCRAHWLGLSS